MLPWITEEDGVYGGAYTEIARELARRAGLTLQIKPCPLKRCQFMLEQGTADIMIGLRETPRRDTFLYFLQTPYREHSADRVFYVRKDGNVTINDYADIAPLRIGTKWGAEYLRRFDRDWSVQRDPAKDMEANFRKLALGRIDAVLIPEDQGDALVSALHLDGQLEKAAFRMPSDGQPRSIAVSRTSVSPERLAALESAMHDMQKAGALTAIYKRHYYDAYHIPQGTGLVK
ncbi:cystine ABC transporter substrate-binding protein [Duganella caerulea]|uniref:substrate-binding periplasmic protein n=1 Tax=Duganella caerulea TaxID=2885762 RepID=UPI0030E8EA5F